MWLLALATRTEASTPLVTEAWQVDVWGVDEGLPQSTVTSIARTAAGRLWLGTFAGLARFDGQRVDVVGQAGEDRPVRITALQAAPDGLWIGTEREGVWRLVNGAIERVDSPEPVLTTVVADIVVASDGALWFGTSNGAWRREDGLWERAHDGPAFDLDAVGDAVWVCGEGLWRWTAQGVESFTTDPQDHCYGGAEGPDGDFWVVKGDRIEVYGDEVRVVQVLGMDADHHGEPFFDASGRVWVGSGEALLDLGHHRDVSAAEVHTPRKRHELAGVARAVSGSESGTLWVGTTGGGLARVAPMGFTAITRTDMRGGGTGAGPAVATDDAAWFSLNCGQLLRAGDMPEPIELPPDPDCISALAAEGGTVWAARGGDVVRRDPDGATTVVLEGPPVDISLLQADGAGGVWAGDEEGRFLHVPADGAPQWIDVPDAVRGRRLLALLVDGDDLALGFDEGVALRTGSTWRVVGPEQGLPGGVVRDLLRDDSGVLWVATYGGGLGWIEGDEAGALAVGRDGLRDAFVSSLGLLDDGQVWLQGNAGLTRARLDDLDAARRDPSHHIPTARVQVGEANGWRRPSAAVVGDQLWLAGVDGMVVVDTSALQQDHRAPGVEILTAQVGDHVLEGQAFRVPPEAWRRLQVDYTAPTLEPGLAVTYEYRLRYEGRPAGVWEPVGTTRHVVESDLAPGAWLFEVRAVALGGEPGAPAQLTFEVVPAWHERGLVRGGVAVLLALLALGLGLARARSAERREARYRQVFTQASNAFLIYGPDGRCVDLNAEACRLFGGDIDTLRQVAPGALGLPDEASLDGPGNTGPILCTRLDGQRFPARVDVVACELSDGVGRMWSVVDLTSLVDAHQQEARLKHQLHVAQRLEALGRLAGGVAHNMNNLFGVISVNLQAVEETPLDAMARECVGDARQGVDRGVGLIRQLLAFSRQGADERQDADLHEVLVGLTRMLELLLPDGVTLETASAPGARVGLGRSRLEQIILNLVINAGDAASVGVVRVAVRTDDDHVVFEVQDEGPGMSPEALEQVFEPFFTTKPVGEGTGLGLPTVKGIVEAAGGRIELDSAPERGTRATVWLPRAAGRPLVDGDPSPAVLAGQGRHLVIVDDNEALIRSMRRQFKDSGYRLSFHTDPVEARDAVLALDAPPALLVTDVVMPHLNGRQLAAAVRARWTALPVLFISGYTADVLGPDPDGAVLEKPFTVEELQAAISAVLER